MVDLKFSQNTNIRTVEPHDLEQIINLNQNAVPHVNSLTIQDLERLAAQSRFFLAAVNDEDMVYGFVLAMDETADYSSLNYQYFRRRYPAFTYIDRIVVGPDSQRKGLGKILYESVIEQMPVDHPVLTCEVNLNPPNPESLAFHERMGFTGVDEQETENGVKRVLLMAKSLNNDQE